MFAGPWVSSKQPCAGTNTDLLEPPPPPQDLCPFPYDDCLRGVGRQSNIHFAQHLGAGFFCALKSQRQPAVSKKPKESFVVTFKKGKSFLKET